MSKVMGKEEEAEESIGKWIASQLNVTFDGLWKPGLYAFTDKVTKSSFAAKSLITARKNLAVIRESYKGKIA